MNKEIPILDDKHWKSEKYSERMPYKLWRQILLAGRDKIILKGFVRQLVAKKIGYGIVEISKEPL